MTTLNPAEAEKARKYDGLILQRLASTGLRRVADAIGVSESTVSRMKDGSITQFCQMLPPLGLKLVPVEMQCYLPEDINPYIHLAKQHMRTLHSAEQLRWED